MKNFLLGLNNNYPFVFYNLTHYIWIIIPIIGLYLMHQNRDKLYNINFKTKRRIVLSIISIMFLNMTIYYLPKIVYGVYDWKIDLPFHFCFIANYLFMYAVLFKNNNLYKIIYFLVFMGTIPTMLFPDLLESFDSFIFYHSFFSHHFFLLGVIFVYYAYDINITFDDMTKAFKFANAIFIIMFVFNNLFGTNYIMQKELPTHILELMPFLYEINYPIIILEATGIITLFIAYIPIYFNNRAKTNVIKETSC
ncbi:MAG: YwaF family protein [Bacilli bacterium]|nr:YwaF family protein [Bacilli bacterium]